MTVFRAPPTLADFMVSDAFVRAVVGPVGSGKSSACVVELLRRAVAQAPGPDGVRRTRWVVVRNTYGQLRDTTRKTFEQWIPSEWGQWHEQQFSWRIDGKRLPDGTTLDCEVLFRALDRPEDVKKLLSLELTGAYINEAREVPRHVLDVLTSRVGRYPSKAQGGPTWFGVWLDTNPWHVGHWGYRLFSLDRPEGHALFEQPGGRSAEAENIDNLPPGYYARICHGKDAEWIAEYVDSKYPDSDRGSIYGHLLAALKARGGLDDFAHPDDGVFTSWDLGISDSTAIWWWRIGKGLDVIDHYEAHGEALSHFFAVVDAKPWRVVKHWLPHDARARTLATGTSILDQFLTRYGAERAAIGPSLSLMDGIQAARWLLEQPHTRIHPRCSLVTGPSDIDGIEALRSYHYEYDEADKAYGRRPAHDWSSHSADAFRYVSTVAKVTQGLLRKTESPGILQVQSEPLTLDGLFRDNEARRGRNRIG